MPLPDPRVKFSSTEEWIEMVLLTHGNPGGRSDLEPQIQAAKTSFYLREREDLDKHIASLPRCLRDDWERALPAIIDRRRPEPCSFDKRPPDSWSTIQNVTPWQFTERRLAKVFLVSEDVPGFDEKNTNWSEINNRKDELVEGYRKLGYEVEILLDSAESLLGILRGRADHRVILSHGDENDGVRCTDHFVSWKEIEDNIGPTGLAHFMSCRSQNAEIKDETDGGEYSFGDALLDAGCSAVILSYNEGHHFDGDAKSGGNIEIQRILGILDRCHELGLKAAMENYRAEYEEMLGPIGASIFTDHEVAAGDPLWGISD